ncbi:hypothetical protein [Psittacicella hinzii]|uniref:Uncharacterized protein n=1 Tax=Psittacicella hinzii TaxID=2028575 RepID=A0A3A1YPF3_9GAMM|nr:hypothetical protein [Psittacicella hinzii]RIY37907.1 hypothetical protein CKF58_04495 [Psittacicella hinzii]
MTSSNEHTGKPLNSLQSNQSSKITSTAQTSTTTSSTQTSKQQATKQVPVRSEVDAEQEHQVQYRQKYQAKHDVSDIPARYKIAREDMWLVFILLVILVAIGGYACYLLFVKIFSAR